MTIHLKEYCGFKVCSSSVKNSIVNFKEAAGDYLTPKPNTLMAEIEGIHAYPFHTRNYTRYMPEALKASEKKWTTPYLKPLIKYHNDQNGKIIGRIYDAAYSDATSVKNVGGLIFTVSIPDKEAEYDVENRLLETVSIGVSTDDVRCSICGSRITDEEGCPEGHVRGMIYDGETCYWDIYEMDPKELSYVIVPSDIYAKNSKVYRIGTNKNIDMPKISESEDKTIKTAINNSKVGEEKSHNMDLEKQLQEANAKNAQLTSELLEAKKALEELAALKDKNAELEKTIEEVRAAVKEKTEALTAAEEKLAASEENLQTVTMEKEAAENTGLETQESFRAFVADTVNQLRRISGRGELKEEEIKKRTMDSLMDSVTDLKEEISNKFDGIKIQEALKQKVPNPVPPKNEKPLKHVQNPEYSPEFDLQEGLKSLFK